MNKIDELSVKIFADGADKATMMDMNNRPYIKGLTTNPSLMKKAGIKDYSKFCKEILKEVSTKPISFEVFSDEFDEMEKQAYEISSWGNNVYVKIPVMNTKKINSYKLIKKLTDDGIKVNVTAVMTMEQIKNTASVLNANVPSYLSVFAGRIADTGVDPLPIMKDAVDILKFTNKAELIWASPRELFNIIQADKIGCHVITVTDSILNKLKMLGYDLDIYSLDTVKMFYKDSIDAGYTI
tara:strand:- start:114 stop:830 length:717 start_codon:yes stop_codon:yes gene_type:complete